MSKLSFHARWIASLGLGLMGLVAIAGAAQAAPGDVSTLAGSGAAGIVNATGTAASFNMADRIAVDSTGNVFVSDGSNHVVRKITPAGVVTTFVGLGAGAVGSQVDGTGTAAGVYGPGAIAVDATDNIYLVTARRIRRITPAGVVTTIAGSNATGSVNGPAATATFTSPLGIAVSSSGDVFVADGGSHLIRKISGGMVSTFAGSGVAATVDGLGAAASFNTPSGMVFDSVGDLFVNEVQGQVVRKIDSVGNVTTFAALGILMFPIGLTVDSANNLYVAARNRMVILRVTPAGVVSEIAGLLGVLGYVDGHNSVATFRFPNDVAVSGSTLFVGDTGNFAVRKVDISGVIPPAGATTTSTSATSTSTSTSISPSSTSSTTSPATTTTTSTTIASSTTTSLTSTSSTAIPATTLVAPQTTMNQAATPTTTSAPLLFAPVASVMTISGPLPPAPPSTVPVTTSATTALPTPTLTVAGILASSSVPPAPALGSVQGETLGSTPAYTGWSNSGALLVGLCALFLGALSLASRLMLERRR
jgi:NHL repeat